MLTGADDTEVCRLAMQLRDRSLLRCIDIWSMAAEELPPERREDNGGRRARLDQIDKACDHVIERKAELPDALFDTYKRNPYERFQKADTVFNQIHIKQPGGVRDMAQLSAVVAIGPCCRSTCERRQLSAALLGLGIAGTGRKKAVGGAESPTSGFHRLC